MTASPSRFSERVLDLFAENPFWSVGKIAGRLGIAFTTAQRAIDRLESVGIVTLAGAARGNRVYCARAILEILDEPARLPSVSAAEVRAAGV